MLSLGGPTLLKKIVFTKLYTGNIGKARSRLEFRSRGDLKSLSPRLSRSSILKTQNRDQAKHKNKPGSNLLEYYRSYPNTDSYNNIFK